MEDKDARQTRLRNQAKTQMRLRIQEKTTSAKDTRSKIFPTRPDFLFFVVQTTDCHDGCYGVAVIIIPLDSVPVHSDDDDDPPRRRRDRRRADARRRLRALTNVPMKTKTTRAGAAAACSPRPNPTSRPWRSHSRCDCHRRPRSHRPRRRRD